jgi:DNA-binding transcriptional MerR regulator
MNTIEPALIQKKELAKRLSVSPRTIDGWVARRVIPCIKVSCRFNLYDLDAVLAALKKQYQVEAVDRS